MWPVGVLRKEAELSKDGELPWGGITISSPDDLTVVSVPGVVAQIVIPGLGKLRQEEYYELHASLRVRSKF